MARFSGLPLLLSPALSIRAVAMRRPVYLSSHTGLLLLELASSPSLLQESPERFASLCGDASP